MSDYLPVKLLNENKNAEKILLFCGFKIYKSRLKFVFYFDHRVWVILFHASVN